MNSSPSSLLLLVMVMATLLLLPPPVTGWGREVPLVGQTVVGQARMDPGDVRFGRNVRVTDGSSPYLYQVEPTMAILSTGRILVGWKEADTHSGPGRRVGFAYSTDGGRTFSSNILMTPISTGDHQSDPWLVADQQDNAYFIWIEYDGPGEGIGVAKTLDGGKTWLAPVQASDTPGFDDKEMACIDASGNIYIVWDHFTDNDADLRFTKSVNGGSTFQPTITFSSPYIPAIACTPSGTLYVTTVLGPAPYYWPPAAIWLTRSTDGGATWSPRVQVNPPGSGELAIITVVDTDSQGNVYVAYAAGSPYDKEIYVTRSTDGGATWSTPVQVNDDTTGMQRMVEMSIDANDTIHVAWLDARHGEWNIYYSRSEDGGATFSPNVRVTSQGTPTSYSRPGDYFTMRPGPDGRIHIVWTDGRGNDLDIYFAKEDMATPILTHAPITSWYQSAPLTITASATDDDYVETVEVHYQTAATGTWRILAMTQSGEELYQITIPQSEVIGPTFNYYLVARDVAGRETRLPTDETTYYVVSLFPLSPTLIALISGSAILIAAVIVISIWYLRRPVKPKTPDQQETEKTRVYMEEST